MARMFQIRNHGEESVTMIHAVADTASFKAQMVELEAGAFVVMPEPELENYALPLSLGAKVNLVTVTELERVQ
ncbi:hypothetical protein NVP1069O_03 [Vibrio phage 1.069.O._10N.286.49.F11]|uniref:Uncharacterized protein n=6 Tax=Autolykiviridae TaxID=2184034 RepID=A0A2I7S822_9VIRU|nr:hypothetical protein KMD65_gp03 [Vibrio phage 1.008.O._10N.286.54.E5]AUR83770.1 hypothetical protein NVP1040O_03 [Vibrio phage 1.040.O._10N.286.45.B9]AUR84649.1 hypothetical protein NVP1062O_03 [Vibrio phage 1.062.O._10N.286.55.C3]AUR85146.1 hypothetical protein NVP1069O_03 [Vibrio phage 1.069.O._10N.286.49.F11]AUR89574.1 hypothetical protein NVP1125O_03 [Vibrio phage 1.125.O._10N.286.49.F5]AUS02063.1 hypothetical protein NVP2092O_03 [Vibrio phage 2.092.O._10N.286.52.B7]